MASPRVSIDSKSYTLASEGLLPRGAVQWAIGQEPSQRGDPGALRKASWRVDGPIGNSYEGPEGFLGVDYGDNVETRWDGSSLSESLNTITLSTYDATSYTATMRPVAAFGTAGFTPSAGSNWQNVDDAVTDDDATYNSASGAATDSFLMGSTGLGSLTPVTKITIGIRVRKTATGTATSVSVGYTRNGTENTTAQTFSIADNTNYQDFTVDVATSGFVGEEWTLDEIEALRFFYSRTGTGNPIRVTQFYVTVTGRVPNACCADLAEGPNGERFLYVGRGRDVAKVDVTGMTLVNPGTVITLAANATSVLTTETPSGTQEVSFGMEGANDYRVITTVAAAGTADTHAANADGQDLRIIAQAPDRVVGLIGQNIYFNILSASNTMSNGNWQSAGVLSGRGIVPTGFAALGKVWVIGTNNGPYVLNGDTGVFEPLVDEIGLSLENCRATTRWTFAGVVTGTINGLRWVSEYGSGTIGPENMPRNTSAVSGYVTALAGHARWLFAALFNARTRDTYILAGRPREDGDPPGTGDMAWFTMHTLTGKRCDFLRVLDRSDTGRSFPVLIGGYGSDMFWREIGRTEDWRVDREGYGTAVSGTLYLTEMRRDPNLIKDLEAVEYKNIWPTIMPAAQTVALTFTSDGNDPESLPATSGNGVSRQLFTTGGVPYSWATGKAWKISATLTWVADGPGPRLEGSLDLYYRERPVQMDVLRCALLIDESDPTHGAEEQADDLRALVDGSGPVLIESDRDRDSGYWKVTDVEVRTVASPGGTTSVDGGDIRVALVTAKRWPQTSGD